MASERSKELMCFLHITINAGPSLMKKMGNEIGIEMHAKCTTQGYFETHRE